ncbi:MAG TPA: hypothetical protein VGR61_06635 [Candidatus Dormibacteraeota bacterium]|nr:hypothetical protein [Candidatus Dormibacteraeota bacterium]
MRLLPFRRRRKEADIAAELDRDVKGTTPIYIDGSVLPDRRSERRPPPKSPGMRAAEPLDDPFPVPFVPPPEGWNEKEEPPPSAGA